ncbi:MAG: tetraacyldisaccharide 4'-kinase [Xanthomonadaceae bacterium]|nr:tetraacyldisaccharide 4'-kinase [Xanthomonadaceae bacterium]
MPRLRRAVETQAGGLLCVLFVRLGALSADARAGWGVRVLSEERLRTIWYGDNAPSLWLRLLSAAFAGVSGLRRRLYAAGLLPRARLSVPVIVVGNINVGGTGKTPLTIALVESLRGRGFKPAVINRGYGGSAGNALRVEAHSDPAVVGDEARLIFDATDAPVAVARKRAAAGRLLLRSGDIDVLIADDGLQHYPLCRDVEICVIDGERRFGNGYLLPAGPLREAVSRLTCVDFRICNGGTPQTGEVPMALIGDAAVCLADPARRRPLREFAGRRVHAVAGIGNPSRFFAKLRNAGIDVIEHAFPDHHVFAAADLDFGDVVPVLMTEKDAVKCAAIAQAHWWSVPVRAHLPDEFLDAVAARVIAAGHAADFR